MNDNVGKYYIEDGIIKETSKSVGMEVNGGIMIYDVIRIIDGIPLFFEDHYERTCQSLQAVGNDCSWDAMSIRAQIHKIVDMNGNRNCNIKFIMYAFKNNLKTIGYISKSYYPSAEEVKNGVPVGLIYLERENPNIKVVNNEYRQKVNSIKEKKGYFEIFLIDREGNVNEGGTSNIFFLKDGRVFTAPEEKVLKGITRMHVIESCREAGWKVIERPIPLKEIWEADAVFLSGTSPKVMPVSSIDEIKFSSARHPIVTAIRLAFDERIDKYMSVYANR